jgi:flagellar biosynthesis/type III secretory pathway ATPase|tara:strand:+ start:1664 stop:2032 length:369 start_codon:yes stop_codon:yes gene_type:complete
MSKKSRKVVDKNKINELLNQKGKDMLGEAFEGVGGVTTIKPIHNMDGAFSHKKLNEDPSYTFGKDNSNIEKGKLLLGKYIDGLTKTLSKNGHKDKAKQLSKGWNDMETDLDDLLDDIFGDIL